MLNYKNINNFDLGNMFGICFIIRLVTRQVLSTNNRLPFFQRRLVSSDQVSIGSDLQSQRRNFRWKEKSETWQVPNAKKKIQRKTLSN